ncbi:hypothetical protein DL96DRAFT_1736847 [Flagelloscypha sp. PMI_526]|nr:hypothetical protein DL96DRAFT_1736847 [Flagelloscypha sp. PMI_526]
MGTFHLTIGALFLGSSFNIYIYGFVCHQYLAYKTMKFNDPSWLRALVAILFMMDTSQTIAELYSVWYYVVLNYMNPSALRDIIWVTPFCCAVTAVSALIVQGFLINRLYRFARQFWLCVLLILAAVVAFLLGIVASIKAGLLIDITKFVALVPLSIAWLAIEAGVDIIITVVLSKALWRSKTGFTRTNTIINRCIWAAIQSGLFSSVAAIAILVGVAFWTDTYLYVIFAWPLGRIYSNSLLHTLVARKEFAQIAYGTAEAGNAVSNSFPTSLQISSVQFRHDTITDVKVTSGVKVSLDQYWSGGHEGPS